MSNPDVEAVARAIQETAQTLGACVQVAKALISRHNAEADLRGFRICGCKDCSPFRDFLRTLEES